MPPGARRCAPWFPQQPRTAGRPEIKDSRSRPPADVAADVPGLELADHGLDVGHLELGRRALATLAGRSRIDV